MVPTMSSVSPRGACEPCAAAAARHLAERRGGARLRGGASARVRCKDDGRCARTHARTHRQEAAEALEVHERAAAVDGEDLRPDVAVFGLRVPPRDQFANAAKRGI